MTVLEDSRSLTSVKGPSCRALRLSGVAVLVSLAVSGSADAGLFGRIRDKIRQRVDARVDNFRKELDTLGDNIPDFQCAKEYRELLKQAIDSRKHCLEDGPPGSPIDKFEKLSRREADAYCGSRRDAECLEAILDDQERFCKERTQALSQKVFAKRKECVRGTVKRFGGKVRDRLRSGPIAKSIGQFRESIGVVAEALRDRPCAKEFQAALKDAVEARRQCLEEAPAGSPIDRYEKFSPKEEDNYCGTRGDNECLAFLLQDQEKFCNQRTEALAKKAIEKRIACR